MKTINNNTKQAQHFINAYNSSDIFSIREAYANPSTAKTRADYNCRMMMQRENGYGYKIIGYNCNYFTVAWIAGKNLRIETACNSFLIPDAAME